MDLFLLTLGGLLGLGALAELLARSWVRSRSEYFILRSYTTTLMRVDRETLPQLESEVRIAINGDGERGPDPPKNWSDTYRVLVAGGSAAECYLLDQETSWPHVIQDELAAQSGRLGARKVHVGNIFSSDLFYPPVPDSTLFETLARLGVLAVEMEAAGLFGAAAQFGARGAAVCTVSDVISTVPSMVPSSLFVRSRVRSPSSSS